MPEGQSMVLFLLTVYRLTDIFGSRKDKSGVFMKNLLDSIPGLTGEEVFEQVFDAGPVRIERIVSRGHTSPASGWYDQVEHEWVLVLQGSGKILFEGGREFLLRVGDHLHIPAHQRHRVAWTDPVAVTIWLAVFYRH
jgi:cupin 2 domain-containing protein